jgi:uncharacterized protein
MNALKIKLSHIPVHRADVEPLYFEERLHADCLGINTDLVSYSKDIEIQGAVRYEKNLMILEAHLAGVKEFQCSRCLHRFSHDFEKDIALDYETDGVRRVNALPEICEELQTDAPIHVLCKEDCKGLCLVCGTNQNMKSCQCQRESR